MVTDSFPGSINLVHTGTFPKGCTRHPFHLSKGFLDKPYYGIDIYEIPNHFFYCLASQWNCGLDGCTAKSAPGVDGAYTLRVSNCEERNEPCSLGQFKSYRARVGSFGWSGTSI